MQTTNTILVSFDHNYRTGTKVLIVGKKRLNESVEIINAFEGKEAEELYLKLVTKKDTDNV